MAHTFPARSGRPGARSRARGGMTLLEIMLAVALMATVMTAVSTLLRTSYGAWKAHADDSYRLESTHAVLRHIVRQIRQADAVTAITAPSTIAGSLTLLMPDGTSKIWTRNGSNEIRYGTVSATDLLGENITELSFTGYKADGSTATTTPAEIQSVKVTAKTTLPRDVAVSRTVTCWAWLRAW